MNSEETEVEKLKRLLDVATAHAVACKALFHSMQDQAWKWEKRAYAAERLTRRQGRIIADLETKLGIDRDL